MAASLPGDNDLNNAGNPNLGRFVTFDPLSGPKSSPFSGATLSWDANNHVVHTLDVSNLSTGALSTGIGIGAQGPIIDGASAAAAPYNIFAAGFNDNEIPGEQNLTYAAPPPNGVVATQEVDSTYMYIGGGKSDYTGAPVPYTAGVAICGAGNGGSRDSGFNTGFAMKMVTATGAVANGAAVEAGYVNRSGVALAAYQSVFGSAAVALVVPT